MVEPEPRSETLVRRWVILSYLVAVFGLGIPLWLYTTSIYRAPLNYDEMDYYDKNLNSLIDIRIPVYLNVGSEFPDLALATQLLVDQELEANGVHGWHLDIREGVGSSKDYNVAFRLGEEDLYTICNVSRDVLITYTLDLVSVGRVPHFVVAVLMDHLFKEEIEIYKRKDQPRDDTKILQYSPMYHLTFSLFYGGGEPISWEMTEALQSYFIPLQHCLKNTVNLTVDTQIQFYSEISSKPVLRQLGDGTRAWVLEKDDLSTFVNFAEWSLTSIHSYPTLHFILYVPDLDHTPLVIKDSVTNSFTVPQWGGVVIQNRLPSESRHLSKVELEPVLETFSSQFLNLIGAPNNPKSLLIRLDILSRMSSVRTLVSSASTLGSLHRLSQSLPNIAIPKPVLVSVQSSVESLKTGLEALRHADWNRAIVSAGDSLLKSQRAFFDKMMVQQAFFPEEHKVAIYMPLLGPVGIVMGIGLVRGLREWRSTKQKVE